MKYPSLYNTKTHSKRIIHVKRAQHRILKLSDNFLVGIFACVCAITALNNSDLWYLCLYCCNSFKAMLFCVTWWILALVRVRLRSLTHSETAAAVHSHPQSDDTIIRRNR